MSVALFQNDIIMIKLYIFESCPYCTRVRALMGVLNIEAELVYVTPGNFPELLKNNIESPTVPVIELSTNDLPNYRLISGSEEILSYLAKSNAIDTANLAVDVGDILNNMTSLVNQLCYPRMLFLELPELRNNAARDYFVSSRESLLNDTFQNLLSQTSCLINAINVLLEKLASKLDITELITEKRSIALSDIIIFAELRTLTMVAELEFTPMLRAYLLYLCHRTGISQFKSINKFGKVSN